MTTGCIGKTLKHSYSAKIHRLLGDEDYRLVELSEEEVAPFFLKKDFSAVNVTIPYKETVIPCLDAVDASAKAIGAVNTVVNENGKLYGYNTDFYGMTALLRHAGIDVFGKTVAILGSGGTAKTARAVCEAMSANEILTVSRTPKDGRISYEELKKRRREIQILINTTPVGMFPNNENTPLTIDGFSALTGVVDAIYNPLRTSLVKAAQKRGIPAEGGLYMLCAQGVKASELFHRCTYPEQTLTRVFNAVKSECESIVLIGMPGAGKTTVGRLLANLTGRRFVDIDEEFVKRCGEISAYFQKHGEAAFRAEERKLIAEFSKSGGIVLATGGGAVLLRENVDALKQNGKIVFLDRDPNAISPDENRPTASSREKILKIYGERIALYREAADVTVHVREKNGLPDTEDAVSKILPL